jgi:hypothetical protein
MRRRGLTFPKFQTLEKVSGQGCPRSWAKAEVLFADVLFILFYLFTPCGASPFSVFLISNLQGFQKP